MAGVGVEEDEVGSGVFLEFVPQLKRIRLAGEADHAVIKAEVALDRDRNVGWVGQLVWWDAIAWHGARKARCFGGRCQGQCTACSNSMWNTCNVLALWYVPPAKAHYRGVCDNRKTHYTQPENKAVRCESSEGEEEGRGRGHGRVRARVCRHPRLALPMQKPITPTFLPFCAPNATAPATSSTAPDQSRPSMRCCASSACHSPIQVTYGCK